MKFLFVTPLAESSSLAQKIVEEGHDLKFYVKSAKYKSVGRGLVPQVRTWRKHKDWADIIVFDDVEMANDIEWLRERGYLVVGGNKFGDKIENDRLFGQKIMDDVGIKTPKTFEFDRFSTAIDFIKKNPRKYVIKFNGQEDRHMCYLGKLDSGKDLLDMIAHFEEKWPPKKKIDFILQELIDGIEMSVGAFFNGKDFAKPINITFEHKHFLTGGHGPLCGEMGTTMFYSQDGGKLFSETLAKMKQHLARTNYRGFIDINNIVTREGAYAIEFTSRFGYPQVDIQQALHETPWGELLYDLAHGKLEKFRVKEELAVGVVIGGPGMPYENAYKRYGMNLPILGLNDENKQHVKLLEAYKKDGKLYTAGGGYPLCVNGVGKTMQDAQKRAYNIVKQIIIPNGIFRTDIGDHWEKDAPLLKKWGYL
jgi:phosphoribosylamine---glycine ligase